MAQNQPNDDNTIQFSMEPITKGYPAVVDDAFLTAIESAKQGGDGTWAYFDAINQTSDFWGWMADHSESGENTFVPGTDPEGRPLMMASTGNVDMRLLSVYAGDTSGETAVDNTAPIIGTSTITTGNTTTQAAQMLALTARIVSMPPYLKISANLFNQLLKPLYANTQTLISKMARNLQESSQVENPSIDPLTETEEVLEEQSAIVEDLEGEVVEEGLEYMSIDWTSAALGFAGMAPLVAIPMIIEFLGHDMYHSLIVQNLTDIDFNWQLEKLVHGETAIKPSESLIPARETKIDLLGEQEITVFSYQSNYQFINSTNLGSIGYVMSLTPGNGGQAAQMVFSIPWTGENSIWVGASNDSPDAIYAAHTAPNGLLSQTATFGNYKVTVSINKLQGKTNGNYFYASMVVIETVDNQA